MVAEYHYDGLAEILKRESGSVAHIYGQNLVAAESLTALGIGGSAWSYPLKTLNQLSILNWPAG